MLGGGCAPCSRFASVLALATHAHAALEVTEIMYNPVGSNTGHQWIEVANTGSDAIDLGAKDIRLFDDKGNHLIKPYAEGDTTLVSGDIAVIAQNPLTFMSDFPSYTGTLMKSAFALTSSGILGITQTDGVVLTKVSYSSTLGAAGDGNSLQRTQSDEAFKPATPTPGVFSSKLPPKLIPPVKLSTAKTSSKKRAGHSSTASSSKSSSQYNYGKGTLAPPASADAEAGGALSGFSFPSIPLPNFPLLSSGWFAAFLGLLAFSTFSLILIQRNQYS